MNNSSISFFRDSDNKYTGINNGIEVSVRFDSLKDPAKCIGIVNEFFSKVEKPSKHHYFRVADETYYLAPENNLILRIIVWACRFFKIIENDSKVHYKICKSWIPQWIWKPELTIAIKNYPTEVKDYFSKLNQEHPRYHDPFTELATTLFQVYEPHYRWKDTHHLDPFRDSSTYQMVVEQGNLVGKKIDDPSVTKEQQLEALKAFNTYMYNRFGNEVIERIQTHFYTDLTKLTCLTPEIVYRMNIGTSIQEEKDLPNPFLDEEYEKIFTGRKLHGRISAWYTDGDDTLYKPWVDQQEFLQTCRKIPNRSWDCFYEDLAFILCKKHLHLKNSDGSYRVGIMIPSPVQGLYYKVTSWTHNSYGIFSYTLEGEGLPAIKLYRSTSSSPYNLDGLSSYKNDFNPLNSPGYEGAQYLEEFEQEFFNKRTIPAWVGYLYQNSLEKAQKAFNDQLDFTSKKPSLKQFIRKHASDFTRLASLVDDHPLVQFIRFDGWSTWSFLSYLRKIVRNNLDETSYEAKEVMRFLAEIPEAKELLDLWNKPIKQLPKRTFESIEEMLEYARSIKETVEFKIEQDLVFVGHSLGGACAQKFLVQYIAEKGRIPLPKHKISARIFDDPAINDEDNELFIQFGNEHAELLEKSSFEIIRRQEAGDIVPLSGETHLGATQNPERLTWLTFDAAVLKASSKAKASEIRDYICAHARMFAAAPLTDYKSTPYDPLTQWDFDHNTKKWIELSKTWKLPFWFNPEFAERVRTYLSAAGRSGFFNTALGLPNPPDDTAHGDWKSFCNSNGVFSIKIS